jgi:hypothetical protein
MIVFCIFAPFKLIEAKFDPRKSEPLKSLMDKFELLRSTFHIVAVVAVTAGKEALCISHLMRIEF